MFDEPGLAIDVEQLLCSLCKGYLSSGPIRALPDGTSICGRCTPSKTAIETPIYRQVVLESVLSKIAFPCRNKQYGCKELILFEQTNDHESKCPYQSLSCPALIPCQWKGSAANILEHITTEHPDLVKKKPIFTICVNHENRKVFLVRKKGVLFVIYYDYSPSTRDLTYDVRYIVLSDKKYKIYGKLQMNSVSEDEYTVGQKSFECGLYADGINNIESGKELKISNLLFALDDPSCIQVKIKFKFVGPNKNGAEKSRNIGPQELYALYHRRALHQNIRRNIALVGGGPKKTKNRIILV